MTPSAVDRREFSRKFSELLELSEAPAGSQSLGDIEEWDSFAVISFIAMVDESYQVHLAANSISQCQTVDELAALVEKRLADGRS